MAVNNTQQQVDMLDRLSTTTDVEAPSGAEVVKEQDLKRLDDYKPVEAQSPTQPLDTIGNEADEVQPEPQVTVPEHPDEDRDDQKPAELHDSAMPEHPDDEKHVDPNVQTQSEKDSTPPAEIHDAAVPEDPNEAPKEHVETDPSQVAPELHDTSMPNDPNSEKLHADPQPLPEQEVGSVVEAEPEIPTTTEVETNAGGQIITTLSDRLERISVISGELTRIVDLIGKWKNNPDAVSNNIVNTDLVPGLKEQFKEINLGLKSEFSRERATMIGNAAFSNHATSLAKELIRTRILFSDIISDPMRAVTDSYNTISNTIDNGTMLRRQEQFLISDDTIAFFKKRLTSILTPVMEQYGFSRGEEMFMYSLTEVLNRHVLDIDIEKLKKYKQVFEQKKVGVKDQFSKIHNGEFTLPLYQNSQQPIKYDGETILGKLINGVEDPVQDTTVDLINTFKHLTASLAKVIGSLRGKIESLKSIVEEFKDTDIADNKPTMELVAKVIVPFIDGKITAVEYKELCNKYNTVIIDNNVLDADIITVINNVCSELNSKMYIYCFINALVEKITLYATIDTRTKISQGG